MTPPSKSKRIALSVSLPPDLASRLTREADERVLAPSVLVEKALKQYLAALPPLDA